MMQCIIGIDIGTTNIKSVTITIEGELIAEFELPHTLSSPKPGYQEQDPDTIFENIIALIKKTLLSLPAGSVVRAVSFSAAMHSIMAVDDDGNPLTPLITWADTRAHDIAQELKQTAVGKHIYQATGTPIHAMSPLCKIAWLKKNEPAIFDKTFKFISVKEYVFFKFFGAYVVDFSIASATGLFDIQKFEWHQDALNYAGIDESYLAKPVPVTTSFNNLSNTYRKQLPLPGEVPFIIGGNDGCLANLGSFAVNEDEAAITIGTSGAVRRLLPARGHHTASHTFQYVIDETHYVMGGPINNGGIVLQWFLKNFYHQEAGEANTDDVIKKILEIPAGCEGLIFLPYVFGERCPVWDAAATGSFTNIQPHHTRTHFLRAVIEGICYSLAEILKLVESTGGPVKRVLASGGFIKSPVWVQVLADILNKPVSINSSADASALGASFVALNACGYINEWKDLKKFFKSGMEFIPDPAVQEIYKKQFVTYQGLYNKSIAGN